MTGKENETQDNGYLTYLDYIDHGLAVSCLALALGKRLGCSKKMCYELSVAGLVHDIGKVRLSRYVERETQINSVEELKYVRLHSMFSCAILEKRGYSQSILSMVLHHHENYDGSGYPRNLRGEEIPFGARILRVCDVYAAMTSNRPYRRAFDHESAMAMMIEEIRDYDLQVFLMFQRYIHEPDFHKESIWASLSSQEERRRLLLELYPDLAGAYPDLAKAYGG
ncbi:MAG TPA: phosphohydrolase [Lachnospiraceae bacterium]|nr:phosphohydrolase [Lachnospiraceae bacterium]